MADIDELADRFRSQAATSERRAPFHAGLSATIAGHPDLVDILSSAPADQQLPVLLLAAIHDQVLADPTCELAAWYPTVTTTPRRDDIAEALLAHCRTRADDLRATVSTRSTQTNEVGRCGLFLPVFGILAREVGELAWGDIGTSGGLTLQLDRFDYEYRPGGTVSSRIDGPSPVRIRTGTRGSVPVPANLPTITHRIGLDRAPIDIGDPVQARWLRACIWPDQADRFHRMEAAIRLAAEHPHEIRTGDAVDDLPGIVAELSRRGHPVLTNSWVLNYLPRPRREAYVAALDALGSATELSWVFAESPGQAPGLPFVPAVQGRPVTALVLVRWRRGRRSVDHLGVAHPHGYWLHWHDA